MTNEPTTEPKIEQWMIDATELAKEIYGAIVLSRRNDEYDRIQEQKFISTVIPIIADYAPLCPRCQRLDEFIAHRDFIHVAELKAEIDK